MTWHKMPDDENLLEDHYWYLIAHRDFATPMKAKYHGEPFPYFEMYYEGGRCVSYLYDGAVKYWTELPEMPEGD